MVLASLLGLEVFSLCSTFSFFFGGSIYSYRFLPKGDCRLCCPIKEDIDITFNLFTRKNRLIPQQLIIGNVHSVDLSNFNSKWPTVVYVHGFTERVMGMSAKTIRRAYLKKGNFNVICVDWGPLSSFPYYAASVKNTRVTGKYLAKLLRFLEEIGRVKARNVHLIGFSLGAETVGFTGKAMNGTMKRITGLDPAYPLYMLQGKRGHLTKTDAKFVDVIHTDGGVFGFPTPLGHVDFYPNGGVALQPGCRLSELVKRGHPEEVVACSHNRAWAYYAESVVDTQAFSSLLCADWLEHGVCNVDKNKKKYTYMGYNCNKKESAPGIYFLKTNSAPPYSKTTKL